MWTTGIKAFEKISSFFQPDPDEPAAIEDSPSINIDDTPGKRKREEEEVEVESLEPTESESKRTRSEDTKSFDYFDLVVIPVKSLYQAAFHKLSRQSSRGRKKPGRRPALNLFPPQSPSWPSPQIMEQSESSIKPHSDLNQSLGHLSLLDDLDRADGERSFDRWLKQVVTQRLHSPAPQETEPQEEHLSSFFDNTFDNDEEGPDASSPSFLNRSRSASAPNPSDVPQSPLVKKTNISIDLTLDSPEPTSSEWRRKRDAEEAKRRDREIAEKIEKLRLLAETAKQNRFDQVEEAMRRKKLASQPKIPLTTDEEAIVKKALKAHDDKILVEGWNVEIKGRDLVRLNGQGWLNDEIINFYMNLLMQRNQSDPKSLKCHFFNTFFYKLLSENGYQKVRTWTRRIDALGMDLIIVPVHLPGHWCLAVINNKEKKFQYFDSYSNRNPKCLETLRKWLISEWKDKKKVDVDLSEWKDEYVIDWHPQNNAWDCGVFICRFANAISSNHPYTFTEEDMPYFRQRIALDILNKKFSM